MIGGVDMANDKWTEFGHTMGDIAQIVYIWGIALLIAVIILIILIALYVQKTRKNNDSSDDDNGGKKPVALRIGIIITVGILVLILSPVLLGLLMNLITALF